MRFSWARIALVSVLATVVVAPLTSALAQQGTDVRVDLNLKDADMMTATQVLFQRTGIQFVVEPSDKPYNKITLKLGGITPEEAVRYICQAAGAYFKRDENGVYVITHDKPVVVAPIVPKAREARPLVKIPILKANAHDVYDAIVYRIPFDSVNGFAELKRFQATTAPASTLRSYQPNLNILGQGLSQTYSPVGAENQTIPVTGSESGGSVALPGETANQSIGGGGGLSSGIGGGGGGGGRQGGGGGLGGGGGGQGGGGGNVNLQAGQGLVGDSIDYITYDPTTNSIVVRGNEDDINQLQGYINMFDVAPQQVQIKVEFITTTEGTTKSLGFEFLYTRGTITAGTTPGQYVRATDPVFASYSTGDVAMRMRASLSNAGGKVIQAPILRTLNNQPATIISQVQTYIFINQTTVSNGTVVTTSNPLAITASTQLSVAPRINGDQTITMFLQPQIQSFVGSSISPNGDELPNTVSQAISVVARCKNQETIVLAGLNNVAEDYSTNRVPVLSDLPIIGQFFRSNKRNQTQSELLIFVTPTILDDEATSGPGGP